MRKISFIFVLLLSTCLLTGCGSRTIEITEDGVIITPATNSRAYLSFKPNSGFYWGFKPETLEDLQEHRDKFAEEYKDEPLSRDFGLAIIDKAIEIVEKKGN